jgi:hypothetical protein
MYYNMQVKKKNKTKKGWIEHARNIWVTIERANLWIMDLEEEELYTKGIENIFIK